MIGFTLSMPNVGSWNGRWSGEDGIYFVSRQNRKKENELDGKYFSYNFGDGWIAGVSCKKMTSQEAKKLSRKSKGFFGYEWMVKSILENDKIICPE
jgi:hypothetical protein